METQTQEQTKQNKPIDINKEIARRNKLFKGKTNAQKRVLIAKDVIEQIKNSKIKVNFDNGEYEEGVQRQTKEGEKSRAFGEQYKKSETRLIKIMENIISNKGTFIP